jgi:selenophosphate synthetase-related protein
MEQGMPTTRDLNALADHLRRLPGVTAKASIGLVADVFGGGDWWGGPGDDGAVVTDRGRNLVVGGEAMLPSFVERDPYGAGISAVLANVNDLAAMGARPLAIIDTIVGPKETARQVLEGLKWASEAYDVPIVGGHLTESDGPPSLSAFGLGSADAVLSATRTEPGQALMLAGCFEGRMREDFLYFPSFAEREGRLDGDVRLLAEAAERGIAVAAKDVSMAGMIGSLGMLLEANRLGATVDLDMVPLPTGVALEDWLACFPCLVFLVTTPVEKVAELTELFTARQLSATRIGTLDDTGQVRIADSSGDALVFDLTRESVTRLGR